MLILRIIFKIISNTTYKSSKIFKIFLEKDAKVLLNYEDHFFILVIKLILFLMKINIFIEK